LLYTDESREYCLTEVFEAQCLKNEVIVMNSATYGRMKIGRCLENEGDVSALGNGEAILGCSVDLLHTFDKRCSLKNRCEVPLALDADIQKRKPCHQALQSYLEASYGCITGKFAKIVFQENSLNIIINTHNNYVP